jgi:hypothetical protein
MPLRSVNNGYTGSANNNNNNNNSDSGTPIAPPLVAPTAIGDDVASLPTTALTLTSASNGHANMVNSNGNGNGNGNDLYPGDRIDDNNQPGGTKVVTDAIASVPAAAV